MTTLICPLDGLGPIQHKKAVDIMKKARDYYRSAAYYENECLGIQDLRENERESFLSVKTKLRDINNNWDNYLEVSRA